MFIGILLVNCQKYYENTKILRTRSKNRQDEVMGFLLFSLNWYIMWLKESSLYTLSLGVELQLKVSLKFIRYSSKIKTLN